MSSTTRTAEVTGPIAGGRGVPFGSPSFDVAAHGCVMEELLLEGEAVSYRPVDGTGITLDGRWSTEEDARAPYRTRMYVVRPVDADRFNGVVLVNWQNVTIGWDLGAPSPADLDHGFAWVGVTAQRVAIEGQPAAGDALPATNGLPSVDPAR